MTWQQIFAIKQAPPKKIPTKSGHRVYSGDESLSNSHDSFVIENNLNEHDKFKGLEGHFPRGPRSPSMSAESLILVGTKK